MRTVIEASSPPTSNSTNYTGAIENAEQFGKRLSVEAWQRGGSRAEKEGRDGRRRGAGTLPTCPSLEPLKSSPCSTHASTCGTWRACYPHDLKRRQAWIGLPQKRWLDQGKLAKLVARLRSIQTSAAERAKKIRNEADYSATNAARRNYPKFRKQHLFVGTGVIEAGCKTVIGHRLKQSGMFGTLADAHSILALRCAHLNGRFEDYWESRRAA